MPGLERVRAKTEAQVLCCIEPGCREVVNGHWFYSETLPPFNDPNPYAGRCRNCGSMRFTVGVMPMIDVVRLQNEGWWLIPFAHDLDIKDPFVKGNIYIMGPKEKVG